MHRINQVSGAVWAVWVVLVALLIRQQVEKKQLEMLSHYIRLKSHFYKLPTVVVQCFTAMLTTLHAITLLSPLLT